jgi:hypothetical protein
MDSLVREIQRVLDLVKPVHGVGDEYDWAYNGYCGAASEAYLHLATEAEHGEDLRVMRQADASGSHWWLLDSKGRVIDLNLSAADRKWLNQHPEQGYPYGEGRGASFRMWPKPSKRAAALIELVKSRR